MSVTGAALFAFSESFLGPSVANSTVDDAVVVESSPRSGLVESRTAVSRVSLGLSSTAAVEGLSVLVAIERVKRCESWRKREGSAIWSGLEDVCYFARCSSMNLRKKRNGYIRGNKFVGDSL